MLSWTSSCRRYRVVCFLGKQVRWSGEQVSSGPYMVIDLEKIYLVYAVKIHVLPEVSIDDPNDIPSDNPDLGMFIF